MNGVTGTGDCHSAKKSETEHSQEKMVCQVPLTSKYKVSSQNTMKNEKGETR